MDHYEVFVKINNEVVKINVHDKKLLKNEITFFINKDDLKILRIEFENFELSKNNSPFTARFWTYFIFFGDDSICCCISIIWFV